jgi:hypothetical protein
MPTFLQYVSGVSATSSGLRMLPMVLGLLATALASGLVVSRTGRYRLFPIAGTAVTTVGLYLLSRMNASTGVWLESLFLLILGAGIGLIMQILTLVVQNTVSYSDLGTATSGVTFFRTLGGSFGASIMGSIYTNQLKSALPGALARARVSAAAVSRPDLVDKLPAQAREAVEGAYAHALQHVFLFAIPIAVLGFVLALFLPQVTMRGVARVRGVGDGFAIPEGSDNERQLANLVAQILRRDNSSSLGSILARSGSSLEIATAWGVLGVFIYELAFGGPLPEAGVETRVGVPHGVLTPFYRDIVAAGYLTRDDQGLLALTEPGRTEARKITAAWQAWLMGELQGWLKAHEISPEQTSAIEAAIGRIALRLVREGEADARKSVTGQQSGARPEEVGA